MRTKMKRVYVQYFCEECGKVEFEGRVFGQDRQRHLQAESGTRTMYCTVCRPPIVVPKIKLSPFFTDPDNHPVESAVLSEGR